MKITYFLAVILLFGLTACGKTGPSEEPPEVVYGRDVCDRCGMIISEPRFAASYVTTTGDVRRFDDLGELLAYRQEEQEEVFIYWVHDYYTEEWLNANEAHFVLSEEMITPMGSGILAVHEQGQAESLVLEWGGTVVTFDELKALAESGQLEAHQTAESEAHDH